MRLGLRHVLPIAGVIALGSVLAAPAFASTEPVRPAGPTPGVVAKSDLHRVEPVRVEPSTKPTRLEPPHTAPVRTESPKPTRTEAPRTTPPPTRTEAPHATPLPTRTETHRPEPARTEVHTVTPVRTETHEVEHVRPEPPKADPMHTQPVKIDGTGK